MTGHKREPTASTKQWFQCVACHAWHVSLSLRLSLLRSKLYLALTKSLSDAMEGYGRLLSLLANIRATCLFQFHPQPVGTLHPCSILNFDSLNIALCAERSCAGGFRPNAGLQVWWGPQHSCVLISMHNSKSTMNKNEQKWTKNQPWTKWTVMSNIELLLYLFNII